MKTYPLKYGRTNIDVSILEQSNIFDCVPTESKITPETFRKRLKEHFLQNNYDYSQVAISVADKARLCGYVDFLPILTEELEKNGASSKNITFYIAYGTLSRQADEKSL